MCRSLGLCTTSLLSHRASVALTFSVSHLTEVRCLLLMTFAHPSLGLPRHWETRHWQHLILLPGAGAGAWVSGPRVWLPCPCRGWAEGGPRVAPSRRRWSWGPCPARSLDSLTTSQALPLRPVPPGVLLAGSCRGHWAGPVRSGWGRAGVTSGLWEREHSCGSLQATSWEGAPG